MWDSCASVKQPKEYPTLSSLCKWREKTCMVNKDNINT